MTKPVRNPERVMRALRAATVAHPIWVGEGAGFGEVRNEEVGYCPNCEKKPSFSGYPVREDGRPW